MAVKCAEQPSTTSFRACAVALLFCALVIVPKAPAAAARILLGRTDITGLAAPLERNGRSLLNLSALGDRVGISLSRSGDDVRLLSGNRAWEGRIGESCLLADDGLRVLSAPLTLRGDAVYAPVDAIEEVSGRPLTIESVSPEPVFTRTAAPAPQRGPAPMLEHGWEDFSIEKTDKEIEEHERLYGVDEKEIQARSRQEKLPPDHESISLLLSQGYVQGADWGSETQASGLISGYRVDAWSQTTMGPKGFEMRAGRFTAVSPDSRWSVQGGDLVSDIWGWGRGGRFRWQASDWHTPTLSYYQRTRRAGEARNVITLTDYFRVRRWLSVGGEVASDGSFMMRQRLQTKRFSLSPYYRIVPGEDKSRGVYGSLTGWKGASLYGGYTRSAQSGLDERRWLDFGLRIPLPRRILLTLQRTRARSTFNHHDVNAVWVNVPIKKLNFFVRYQHRDTDIASRGANAGWFGFQQHEFFGGATYRAGRRFNVSMQSASRWRRDGAIDQWQQISGTIRFDRKSWLEALSILPDVNTPGQQRFRFTREINEKWAVVLEYGNVPPYQGIEVDPEDERAKILLRRGFRIPTPAVGGDVEGVVADPLGYALEGVIVRLGDFATLTDAQGRYQFRYVPEGEHQLFVDEKSLPADYMVSEDPRTIETAARSFHRSDWTIIPLNTVAGRVCLVAGPRQECDIDSGLESVAVYLDDLVIATRERGTFLFHNVTPGRHSLRIDPQTLPERVVATSPLEITIEVEAGKRAPLREFRLRTVSRAVVFQTLDEDE